MSRIARRILVILVVVSGLGIAAVRVTMPNADRYRDQVAAWLGDLAGHPVTLGALEAGWRGIDPELRIDHLSFGDDGDPGARTPVLARFDTATVTVDLLGSLLAGDLRPRRIRVGDVTLDLDGAADAGGDAPDVRRRALALVDWLLPQRDVSLHAESVTLGKPTPGKRPLILTDVELEVLSAGDRHRAHASAKLPRAHGERITAEMDLVGRPEFRYLSGDITLRGEGLDLGLLESLPGADALESAAGRADAVLATRWRSGRLSEVRGELRLVDTSVESASGRIAHARIGWDLHAEPRRDGWQVRVVSAGEDLVLARKRPALLEAILEEDAGTGAARVRARLRSADVEELLPLLPLAVAADYDTWTRLRALRPRGRMQDITLAVLSDGHTLHDIEIAGELRGGTIDAARGLPALADVAGHFSVNGTGARLALRGGTVTGALAGVAAMPFAGEHLRGAVTWQDAATGARLLVDDLSLELPEVTASLAGTVAWPTEDAAPRADLELELTHGDLVGLAAYLPIERMGDKSREWFHGAFSAGRIERARLSLRGPLAGDGVPLEVAAEARVSDADMRIHPNWPVLSDITADITFARGEVRAVLSEGRFWKTPINETVVRIDDVHADIPVLTINGTADGRSQDGLRVMREAPPLHQRFATFLDNLQAEGAAHVELGITIPLSPGTPDFVTGSVEVSDNALSVHGLEHGFDAVAGTLSFNESSLQGHDVTGRYLDGEVSADVEVTGGDAPGAHISLRGTSDRDHLRAHLRNTGLLTGESAQADALFARMSGATAWQAVIDVDDAREEVTLRVESDMRGVALDLPAPLAKGPAGTLATRVETRIAADGRREMRIDSGDALSAVLALAPRADTLVLERAAVRFGGGAAELPAPERLRVSGNLEHLDPREWTGLLVDRGDGGSTADEVLAPASLDLHVGRLVLLGTGLSGARLQASRTLAGDWHAKIASGEVLGWLEAPAPGKHAPVVMEITGLDVTPDDAARADSGSSMDPRELPPLRLICRLCTLNGLELARVEVLTSPLPDGLHVDLVDVRGKVFDAKATGAWTRHGDAHRSKFDMRLASGDLGALLASLGFEGDATSGGNTELELSASWQGPPSAFDMKRIEGALTFQARNGVLNEVERGATGRVFGLLILTDIPRRLRGDFSDLFDDGFTYDHLQGNFNIEGGNAYTQNLTLEGATARIRVAGRTGLAAEDYDQIVTVTPKLTSSLPLAPIWLVEKMLDIRVLDDVFAYRYTITGSWESPSVERVKVTHDPAERS